MLYIYGIYSYTYNTSFTLFFMSPIISFSSGCMIMSFRNIEILNSLMWLRDSCIWTSCIWILSLGSITSLSKFTCLYPNINFRHCWLGRPANLKKLVGQPADLSWHMQMIAPSKSVEQNWSSVSLPNGQSYLADWPLEQHCDHVADGRCMLLPPNLKARS